MFVVVDVCVYSLGGSDLCLMLLMFVCRGRDLLTRR
jgi:hypothetical protein